MKKLSQKMLFLFIVIAMVSFTNEVAFGQTNNQKPNILMIMGDDIGIPNISYLSFGMMGYKTPNIDRIAKEGMYFTACRRRIKYL